MPALGETFRALRKSKGLTLKEIADEQVSVAVISKFENGTSMLGVDRFLHLLDQIHVTTSEFFYWQTNRYAVSPMPLFGNSDHASPSWKLVLPMQKILELVNKADPPKGVQEVENYQKEFTKVFSDQPTQMNSLVMAIINSSVDLLHFRLNKTASDILPVTKYLTSVEQWGEFEIYLLIFSVSFLDASDLFRLFKREMYRADWYKWLADDQHTRFNLCFDAFSALIGKQHYTEAAEVLKIMDNLVHDKDDSDVRFAVQNLFMHGWYDIVTGEKEKGKQQCENALSVYRILNVSGDEELLRLVYEHILKYDPSDVKHMFIILTMG